MTEKLRYLTVAQVAARCQVSRKSVHRWILHGINGVRLGAVRMGGFWRVDPVALEKFTTVLTEKSLPPDAPPVAHRPATPAARHRKVAAAREELRRLGC
jgi:hypothetical protein